MALSDAFVVKLRRHLEKGTTTAAAAPVEGAVAVFLTPKSLTSFPVASSLVCMMWALAKQFFPGWGTSVGVALAASLVVGLVIFVASTTDPDSRPKSPGQWFVSSAVAFFNSLFLAAAAIGILDHK
jgi:hypothetical protein